MPTTSTPGSIGRRVVLSVALLAAVGALVAGALAAFSDTQANSGNTLQTGSLTFANNSASTLFNMTNAVPGDSVTRCYKVTSTGGLPASVAASGSVTGALASSLLVSVEEGSGLSGVNGDCAGFTSSGPTYVMGTNAGGVAPSSMTTQNYASWASSVTKSYRIAVSLPSSAGNSAQGQSASATFTWDASGQAGGAR